MARLRTMRGLMIWAMGVFLIAQFAGVVSSELIFPQPGAGLTAPHAHSHHADSVADSTLPHHHHHGQGQADGDHCCALHTLAAVLPTVLTSAPLTLVAVRLFPERARQIAMTIPNLPDRPPRTFA